LTLILTKFARYFQIRYRMKIPDRKLAFSIRYPSPRRRPWPPAAALPPRAHSQPPGTAPSIQSRVQVASLPRPNQREVEMRHNSTPVLSSPKMERLNIQLPCLYLIHNLSLHHSICVAFAHDQMVVLNTSN